MKIDLRIPDRFEREPQTRKIHELSSSELDIYRISIHSLFKDDTWSFENPTPGAGKSASTLNWGMSLADGSTATAPQNATRLRWAKILMLTLLVMPAKGHAPAPGGMRLFQQSFSHLLSWMCECGYQHPHELTPTAIRNYIDHLADVLVKRADDGEITLSPCTNALAMVVRLWDQRQAIARMGILPMDSHPFDGKSPKTIARAMVTKADGWIKPMPDEVSIPLLNKATWFLGTPADDVLRLLHTIECPDGGPTIEFDLNANEAEENRSVSNAVRYARAKRFLSTFEFGTISGSTQPWHEPIDLAYRRRLGHPHAEVARLRELWEAVRDAAAIVIQATSGMRASELLGINSGIDEATGLPAGVRLEASVSGLYEWFVLRSKLSKTTEGQPLEVDWVLGMRPMGSHEIPLAVRALCILNGISKPWRPHARTKYLLLTSVPGQSLPVASTTLDAMKVDKLNQTMRRFIERWIDLSGLPDESARKIEDKDLVPWRENRGAIFSTHMLRKAWAQFALACDSRLLPVIQMQFHHLSLAMTEGGYIGRNPLLLEELSSMAVQKRNQLLFETITGKTSLAGRMGEQLERALAQLREDTGNIPTSDKWKRTVEWADRNDLTMFFTAHATCCPTRTSQMRCHDVSNTPIWIRKAPNTATREPSLCAGCACAIMDASHEPFWSERYVSSKVSIHLAETAKMDMNAFREVKFRADQAHGILKKFGTDFAPLDSLVLSRAGGTCQD